jgi:hypothetical protein
MNRPTAIELAPCRISGSLMLACQVTCQLQVLL